MEFNEDASAGFGAAGSFRFAAHDSPNTSDEHP